MQQNRIRILLLEDNPGDRDLMRDILDMFGEARFDLETFNRLAGAVDRLARGGVDVVISDLWLPDSQGFDTFRKIQAAAPGIPVVVLSDNEDDSVAVEAVKQGAQDYFVKGMIDGAILVRSLHYAIERKRIENEKAQLQEQLIRSQKMQAIGQLSGGVAHDFNNLLTVILGNAHLGLLRTAPTDPVHELFAGIMTASEQARVLTLKLLTFARSETIDARPASVNALIQDLADLMQRTYSKKITITTNLAGNEEPVVMDSVQMFQAILNVCNNASDAMPDGGALCIESRMVCLDGAGDGPHPEGCYYFIEIRDSGTGIAESIKHKIFEPFITTKGSRMSTGLGLSITQSIVASHGGHITIHSNPDRGTCVRIFLPVAGPAQNGRRSLPLLKALPGAEKVLLVDDEPMVLEVSRRILNESGYVVFEARGGKEALEVFGAHQDEVDIVVLDLVMPEMDGQEVFHALRKIAPDLKIILASGFSRNGIVTGLIGHGAAGFIQKPFSPFEITRAIREALDNG